MAAEPDEVEEAPKRRPADFARTYVWTMGVIAVVLLVAWWVVRGKRDAYRDANEMAPRVLGSATAPAAPAGDARPTTIRGLALGVQKYVQTFKDAKVRPEEGSKIPLAVIQDRATGQGLQIRVTPTETTTPVRSKGYEEVSASFTFENSDLLRLARFLYSFESWSTKYRVLELKWDLRSEKTMPYNPGVNPGNLIQGPTVKIGFRRPISTKTTP